jgi:integrase/recombinase XerD
MTALRESTAFKVGYACAGANWSCWTSGSGPLERTLLTTPEFAWMVQRLEYRCTEGRQLFASSDPLPRVTPDDPLSDYSRPNG